MVCAVKDHTCSLQMNLLPQKRQLCTAARSSVTTQLLPIRSGKPSSPLGSENGESVGELLCELDGGRKALREHPRQERTMGDASMNDVMEQRAIKLKGNQTRGFISCGGPHLLPHR